MSAPSFSVVPGRQVQAALRGREREVAAVVEGAYRLHGTGDTVNPPSSFLRFPDRPASRIIALPASVGAPIGVDGVKWISSFPDNVRTGLPRASAVLILNDPTTGYPFACLEASVISAARTASSAALAADHLTRTRTRPRRVGFVGAGLVARYVHTHLVGTGWEFDEVGVFDLSADSAAGLAGHLAGTPGTVRVHPDAESLVRASDLVVLATVAGTPHMHDPGWFDHAPVVLHVSLRDLSPDVLLSGFNLVDDVEHCLRAETSPHLVQQRTGSRDFLAGTLHDVLTGRVAVPGDQPVFFSPFGLGVLDLAVGAFVHQQLAADGALQVVPEFFTELSRHG
ncbi:2,3-diaminopropionate biosynthesis protein SbnB [Modestobacter sp. Leaf380]|uniref:2,3-diaminopropionate biosynthesis protein SbnB n=1 Tax=Modestobacter sp. Leaf380 TaxID=1736356 RepID=UPI00070049B1|nr:2,3-diaminopropionate biosynthesis protein SbnB [Modestobacter sp. Leaf380]KQS71309.1 2,3-diaminopropionate biosynthesis protein SbnB [Modestobacter sp. Leaf380]